MAREDTTNIDDLTDALARFGQIQTTCTSCGMSSDKLEVKACSSSIETQYAGGCTANICTYCVMEAQRHLARLRNEKYEIHYCRPCSEAVQRCNTLERCRCSKREDVLEQERAEWRCRECQVTACDTLERVACNNLLQAEDEGRLYPREGQNDRYAGLERWIDLASRDRNSCPGCGCNYACVEESFWGAELDDMSQLPTTLVRQCVVCLEQKA